MVKLIMGVKGSGKTKRLVDMVREAVAKESGDVICIEKDKKLTYDVPYQARLIDTSDYGINSYDLFRGFLCGIHSGNYDITHFFIDNFYKIVNDDADDRLAEFVKWLDGFCTSEGLEVVISISKDPAAAGEELKKFIV
ncbi:MAG TPA: hypothetical protein PLD83_05295 [Oscillospiraceae bacterium]|nr:hypothetical protein [Oscillospiraceae bacterium]HNY00042.1 hypothetical protein [Oscillospiraceae bacterium]HPS75836.1 hypothetical protein [Oscillospiraceae bacterium]